MKCSLQATEGLELEIHEQSRLIQYSFQLDLEEPDMQDGLTHAVLVGMEAVFWIWQSPTRFKWMEKYHQGNIW